MKIKVRKLQGAALDYAIAMAMGKHERISIEIEKGWVRRLFMRSDTCSTKRFEWAPTSDERIMAMLCDEHHISIGVDHSGIWVAFCAWNATGSHDHMQSAVDRRTAIARCYVAMRLGTEVSIPVELL